MVEEKSEDPRDETFDLLRRTHAGDDGALHGLLARHLDWLRARVHLRLGRRLRHEAETQDFVQEVAVRVLRDGPRFLVSDSARFRALLCRMVENALCDAADHAFARRRRAPTVAAGATQVVALDQLSGSMLSAEELASNREQSAWVEIALELLDAEDRALIRLREWDRMEFAVIGTQLSMSSDAARMRFNRALGRLAAKIVELRSSGFDPAGLD
ncbi:MAG: sigma-70 family RNA polymerase sigma factor [Planctomycetota bacterium]